MTGRARKGSSSTVGTRVLGHRQGKGKPLGAHGYQCGSFKPLEGTGEWEVTKETQNMLDSPAHACVGTD